MLGTEKHTKWHLSLGSDCYILTIICILLSICIPLYLYNLYLYSQSYTVLWSLLPCSGHRMKVKVLCAPFYKQACSINIFLI